MIDTTHSHIKVNLVNINNVFHTHQVHNQTQKKKKNLNFDNLFQ